MKFDLTQSCAVGIRASEYPVEQVRGGVVRECDGCGVKIIFTAPMLDMAAEHSRQAGLHMYCVCHACSTPWIDQVIDGKTNVAAATGVAHDDLLANIARRRQERIERN